MTHLEYMKKHKNKLDMYGYPETDYFLDLKEIDKLKDKIRNLDESSEKFEIVIDGLKTIIKKTRNPYVQVAKDFDELNEDINIKVLRKDYDQNKKFYYWLKDKFNKFNTNIVFDSYVLDFLYKNEFDNKVEKLKKFVFYPFSKDKHYINQKWHFFISWYAFREFQGTDEYYNEYKEYGRNAIIKSEWEKKEAWVFEEKYGNKELIDWLKYKN